MCLELAVIIRLGYNVLLESWDDSKIEFVEQFKAMSLSAVDELLREVTLLRNELAGDSHASAPLAQESAMSSEESSLLARFRSASSEVRHAMLVGQTQPAPSLFPAAPPMSGGTDWASSDATAGSPNDAGAPRLGAVVGLGSPPQQTPAPDHWPDSAQAVAPQTPADEPGWLRSLNDEAVVSDASSNWFLDDAFDGDVPAAAFETRGSQQLNAATPEPARSDQPAFGSPTPSWVVEPPPSAWQAPPSSWDAPGASPEASSVPSVVASAPALDGHDTHRQIDELFNQLDFGPPPAGVLAIAATAAATAGNQVAMIAPTSPLHVEQPMENPLALPAPTPPWSGWIQS